MDEKKRQSLKEYWNRKKVFITGACGFIGSWLTLRLLELGAQIVILYYKDELQSPLIQMEESFFFKKIPGDLKDDMGLKKIFFSFEFDIVIHLGAKTQVIEAIEHPYAFFDVNVKGTYNLLEACRLSGQDFESIILASTDKVYGEQTQYPFTENSPLLGKFPYESSKICLENIAKSYYHTYALPIVITRSANVFGGGDFNWNRLIPGTIKSLLHDEPISLRGSGHNLRDYIFVEDVVQAYLHLGAKTKEKKLEGEIVNISSMQPRSVIDIVERLKKVLKKENHLVKIHANTTFEIEHQIISGEKIEERIGFKPQFPLDLSLDLTAEWYMMYFDQKRKTHYALSDHRC